MRLAVVFVAVLTDIHGNTPALDAVLADARRAGADRFWLLGDLVAMGPDPVGTAERLQALDADVMIMGNTDRHVLRDEGPLPPSDQLDLDPVLVDRIFETAASTAWTKGALTTAGFLDWLATGVPTERRTLPDGTTVLTVHATPERDEGRQGITPAIDDDELLGCFAGTTETLVFGGHTHDMTDRTIGSRRFVNPGSVSNPPGADKRARYALLHADDSGHHIELRAVVYDVGLTIGLIESSGIPGRSFLVDSYFR